MNSRKSAQKTRTRSDSRARPFKPARTPLFHSITAGSISTTSTSAWYRSAALTVNPSPRPPMRNL